MATVRRCLGCKATYPADEPACPKCGSYAGEVEQAPEPARRRKS
jgi:rRNA maturation endonuclease Nob1